MTTYRNGERGLTVYRAYYAVQRQDREAVNELNYVFDAEHWTPRGGQAGIRYRRVAIDPQRTLTVIETRLTRRDDFAGRLVWHWYSVAGKSVAAPWQAKLAQMSGALRGRRDAMVLAVSVDSVDVDQERRLLADFVMANLDALQDTTAMHMPYGGIAQGGVVP